MKTERWALQEAIISTIAAFLIFFFIDPRFALGILVITWINYGDFRLGRDEEAERIIAQLNH